MTAQATAIEPPAMTLPHQISPVKTSRASPSLYHLDVRQQPRQARMAGSGEKADRRPIDPPPIIRLRIRRPSARKKPAHLLTDDDLATPTLTHTLFMFASLVEEDSEQEMFEVHGSKSALVAGSVVSSLFHLREQSCFVFPDMSVRMEGRWRFKMSLYEVSEEGVEFRTSILTDVFQVYSSKRFPGMGKSTELSKSFAQQGLKLRIRRPGAKDDTSDDGPAPTAKTNGKKRGIRQLSEEESFAEPAPRRPSAPVASTSHGNASPSCSRQRAWSSWDAGSDMPDPRVGSQRDMAPLPSRTASYGFSLPRPPSLQDSRPRAPIMPPSFAATASTSGSNRDGSTAYYVQTHPYGPNQSVGLPPSPSSYPYPHPGHRGHGFSHPALPHLSYTPPHSLALPLQHRPRSPPPVLPPIRHYAPSPPTSSSASAGGGGGGGGSTNPSGSGTTSASSLSSSTTSPATRVASPSFSALGPAHAPCPPAARRWSPPALPAGGRPQTQALESSVRSTDAAAVAAGAEDAEPAEGTVAAGRTTPLSGPRMGSSLAMLLGEGRDAKELDGEGDGSALFV